MTGQPDSRRIVDEAPPEVARELLVVAVLDVRRGLSTRGTPDGNLELELIHALLDRLAETDGQVDGRRETSAALGERLAAIAGRDDQRRTALVDVLGLLACRLAPAGRPPPTAAGATAWRALVIAVDQLSGSGAKALGRLPFINEQLLNLLVAEADVQLPQRPTTGRRLIGEPGSILGTVAVSRKLCQAIAGAVGFAVAPAYEAVYIYEPPGSHVATHVHASDYEIRFHLILEHTVPATNSEGSALVAHLPDASRPTRFLFRPGEAVALRSRGTIHSWDKLQADECRTLITVGFQRATRVVAGPLDQEATR